MSIPLRDNTSCNEMSTKAWTCRDLDLTFLSSAGLSCVFSDENLTRETQAYFGLQAVEDTSTYHSTLYWLPGPCALSRNEYYPSSSDSAGISSIISNIAMAHPSMRSTLSVITIAKAHNIPCSLSKDACVCHAPRSVQEAASDCD